MGVVAASTLGVAAVVAYQGLAAVAGLDSREEIEQAARVIYMFEIGVQTINAARPSECARVSVEHLIASYERSDEDDLPLRRVWRRLTLARRFGPSLTWEQGVREPGQDATREP